MYDKIKRMVRKVSPHVTKVRVRFAPSPTGIPHVGNIRTALFNYFFAKAAKGSFILRIEDTDQARKIEGAAAAIEESLKWLGVTWDEHIVQSENLSEYKKRAEELIAKGLARVDDGAIRFIVPKEGLTSWTDAVGNKKIEFQNSEIEDFIILKGDGFPTYHLANIIDDHDENITHVIRGEDWISSTPKHILLYSAFEWDHPVFAHVPNIFGTDGKKLSKRRGAKSVLDYKKEGFLPDALLNYLMLLGFSPKDNREVLSIHDFEKEFIIEKINVSPTIFDEKKLLWMNGVYIREKSNDELKKLLGDFYNEDDSVIEFLDDAIINLAKTRMSTLANFKTLVSFEPGESSDQENKIQEELSNMLANLSSWTKDSIFEVFKKVLDEHQVKMPVIYKIFTGCESGLPLPDFLQSLGKDKTLSRLSK